MLGVFYKYGLFRITAFSVVGIVIIVSTQLLRGQDPTAAIGKISHFIRSATGLAQDPTSSAAPAVADAQVNGDALQPNMSIAPASPAVAETLTFAADQARPPLPDVPESCQKRGGSTGSTVIGDKIQFRFFAKVGVPRLETKASATAPRESVAFERLDLSGTYDVAEDGTVALPMMGRLALAGQTLACAEAVVASAVAAQDASVSAVIASFASRLPVTVSGAVNAPGAYTHAPGMTVNRLLNLAGASFSESPITASEFETLQAQRDEILHRQILAALQLSRLQSTLAGKTEIAIASDLAAKVSADLISSLIAAETAALHLDVLVDQATDQRSAVAIAGLRQKLADVRKQLAQAEAQVATLQVRHDEMSSFKSRGLIQGSQLDVLLSNLMELNRIKMQLATDESNLTSQIDLAETDAKLAIQRRQQDLTGKIATLSGDIDLYEVQITAIEVRLAKHGLATDGSSRAVPLAVSVLRTEVTGTARFDATLDTLILPGDTVTVSRSASVTEYQPTAANGAPARANELASDGLQE